MADYDISELSELSGVTRRNIHFYVQQGLLPPAEGAGLGARYSDAHLLRLKAIPLLRARGLRLDQIRARLSNLNTAGVETLLADLSRPKAAVADADGRTFTGVPRALTLTRYQLAPGVELTVDAGVGHKTMARVAELLRACGHIFGGDYGRPDGGER
ncbi:MAG TPA: MerR family transcriptional regulator [Pyrinomonadaceae bacterium]|nr:MerR family transcriptional regulator [Pyrinomonadaceae bacterium]